MSIRPLPCLAHPTPAPTPPLPTFPGHASQLACLFVVSAHNPLPAQFQGPVLLHAAMTGAVQPLAAVAQQVGKGVATATAAGVQQVGQLPPVRAAGQLAQRVGKAAATGAQQFGRAAATGAQQVGKGLAAVPGVQQVQRMASNLGREAAGLAAAGLAAATRPGLARSRSAPTGLEPGGSGRLDAAAAVAAAAAEAAENGAAPADLEAALKSAAATGDGEEAAAAAAAAERVAAAAAAAEAAEAAEEAHGDPVLDAARLKALLEELADGSPAAAAGQQGGGGPDAAGVQHKEGQVAEEKSQHERLVEAVMEQEEEMVADLGLQSHWTKVSRRASLVRCVLAGMGSTDPQQAQHSSMQAAAAPLCCNPPSRHRPSPASPRSCTGPATVGALPNHPGLLLGLHLWSL